jgi:hypothetical protein
MISCRCGAVTEKSSATGKPFVQDGTSAGRRAAASTSDGQTGTSKPGFSSSGCKPAAAANLKMKLRRALWRSTRSPPALHILAWCPCVSATASQRGHHLSSVQSRMRSRARISDVNSAGWTASPSPRAGTASQKALAPGSLSESKVARSTVFAAAKHASCSFSSTKDENCFCLVLDASPRVTCLPSGRRALRTPKARPSRRKRHQPTAGNPCQGNGKARAKQQRTLCKLLGRGQQSCAAPSRRV